MECEGEALKDDSIGAADFQSATGCMYRGEDNQSKLDWRGVYFKLYSHAYNFSLVHILKAGRI